MARFGRSYVRTVTLRQGVAVPADVDAPAATLLLSAETPSIGVQVDAPTATVTFSAEAPQASALSVDAPTATVTLGSAGVIVNAPTVVEPPPAVVTFEMPGLTTSTSVLAPTPVITFSSQVPEVSGFVLTEQAQRDLAETTERMLDAMPPYYAEDPAVETVLEVQGREIERIEEFARVLANRLFPHAADDQYGLLGLWENLLGLPVAPAGTTLEERRSKVLANLRGRNVSSGEAWERAMTLALGTSEWTYVEHSSPYVIAVTLPFAAGYTYEQVQELARRITPAHLDLIFPGLPGGRFRVDISEVGDEL